MQDYYDIVIIGGGTAGCSAAYNAGMLGLKTLLVEKKIHLGGAITSGRVIPAMMSSENQINADFFKELTSELQKMKGQVTYLNNPGWFNPELCKTALDRLMSKANVEVLFDTHVTGINIVDKDINGITVSSNMLSEYIATKYVIDATGNCEFSALAGCKFLDENGKKYQPVSLRFEMAGVDLKTFSEWLLDFDSNRNVTTSEVIDGQIHLSTAYTSTGEWGLEPLFKDAVDKNILNTDDIQYFQLFTIPGMFDSVSFNCPRIHFDNEIDPLDNTKVSKALVKGRESVLRIAEFCKTYFPGFENAYISNIADSLGVRVSRRIKGKYVYTVEDLRSGKTFENPALIGNYPIDIHSNKAEESVLEYISQDYQLPIEALMSSDYDNLFVAGRCLSADFEAQAALRIQPSCFSMGESVAKHIADLINK